jgi:hypothetical protein
MDMMKTMITGFCDNNSHDFYYHNENLFEAIVGKINIYTREPVQHATAVSKTFKTK